MLGRLQTLVLPTRTAAGSAMSTASGISRPYPGIQSCRPAHKSPREAVALVLTSPLTSPRSELGAALAESGELNQSNPVWVGDFLVALVSHNSNDPSDPLYSTNYSTTPSREEESLVSMFGEEGTYRYMANNGLRRFEEGFGYAITKKFFPAKVEEEKERFFGTQMWIKGTSVLDFSEGEKMVKDLLAPGFSGLNNKQIVACASTVLATEISICYRTHMPGPAYGYMYETFDHFRDPLARILLDLSTEEAFPWNDVEEAIKNDPWNHFKKISICF